MKFIVFILLSFGIVSSMAAPPVQLTAEQNATIQKLIAERDAAKALADAKQAELEKVSRQFTGVAAPSPPGPDSASTLFNTLKDDLNLKVRRTLKDGKENSLPATLQYTSPADGKASWAADIGISMGSRLAATDLDWSASGEYHYNRALPSPVDTFIGGLGVEGDFGDLRNIGASWKLDGSYKRDNVIAGEGALVSLQFFPVIAPWKIGHFKFGTDSSFFSGRIEAMVGGEFETGNGASAKFPDGKRLTLRSGLSLTGWLFPKHFDERIETTASLGYWANVDTTGFYRGYDENQLYFLAALTYWLDTRDAKGNFTKHFGISARYANGDNPVEGAFNQNVWTFGFAVIF